MSLNLLNPTGILTSFPGIKAWSDALLANEAVVGSVAGDFSEVFNVSLHKRESLAAKILDQRSAAAE